MQTSLTRKLPPSYRRLGRLLLRVVAGPDAGRELAINLEKSQPIRGGRNPVNDIVLSDSHVSTNHFELKPLEQGLLLTDLGSMNGILIGGVRIKAAWLDPNTIFQVGETALQLISADEVQVPLSRLDHFEDLYGRSDVMRELFAVLERLTSKGHKLRVLINGETGTGKELVARALHTRSARSSGPFVVRDCSTIPRDLAETILFGHVRGTFTGAHDTRVGCFEHAHGGTLFLDEIAELPLETQSKLLRVLEEGTIERVGDSTRRKVDVRVICATHRDLRRMVGEERFRQDLYFRLAEMRLEMPPLRDRGDDIVILSEHFLTRQIADGAAPKKLGVDARAALKAHRWPGNVRELRSVIERALVMADGFEISADDLGLGAPDKVGPPIEHKWFEMAHRKAVTSFERQYFECVMARFATRREAATFVGMTEEGLRQALRRVQRDD